MAGMVGNIQDPALKRTIQQLDAANMDPAMRKSYDQMAAAGMKLMWSDGEVFQQEREEVIQQIKSPDDIPQVAAHVAVKIVSLVQEASKQQDILLAVGPASTLYLVHTLEFIEVATKMQVTPEILAESQLLLKEGLMDLYKITPEILERVAREHRPNGPAGAGPTPPATAPPAAPTKGA